MKLTQAPKSAGELDDVARAAGINTHRQVFSDGEIVNRREMKDAGRLSLDQLEIPVTQREFRLADISLDKLEIGDISVAARGNPGNLCTRAIEQRRLHEEDEIAVLPRESFEEPVRDETWKSGYEECLSIRHRLP
jgi:hypothetical protein